VKSSGDSECCLSPESQPGDDVVNRFFAHGQATFFLGLWLISSAGLDAQPINDNFVNRTCLGGMTNVVQGSLDGATLEDGEPAGGGNGSIWWSWTAAQTGAARFRVEGGIIQLYRGSSLGELQDLVPTLDRGNFAGLDGPLLIPVQTGDVAEVCVRGSGGLVTLHIESYLLPPKPANDDFIAGTVVSVSDYRSTVSLASSTFEAEEPSPTYRLPPIPTYSGTLWWNYTAPCDGVLRFWTDSPSYLAILGLYQGEQLASLALVQHQCGGVVTQTVSKGDRYQISIAGPSLPLESFSLFIQTLEAPTNNDFANRIPLEGARLSVTGRTVAATRENAEPSVSTSRPGQTVWYSWVAPFTGRVVPAVTYADRTSPGLAVYTGPTLDRLNRVPMSVYQQPYAFLAIQDTIYLFQIDGSGTGDFVLTVTATPLPPSTNDNFADATVLRGTSFSALGSMLDATMEPGEPAHLGGTPAKSIWWKWLAPRNGTFSFYTGDSLVTDPVLAIYKGRSVDALTLVSKGVGLISLEARGGDIYSIAGAAPAAAVGDFVLNVSRFSPDPTPHDLPGNLVDNPSFESDSSSKWQYVNYGGAFHEFGAADGGSWLILGEGFFIGTNSVSFGSCAQDIPTVAGRKYQVRFAYALSKFNSYRSPIRVRVTWDQTVLGDVAISDPYMWDWNWLEFNATATSSLSRLQFENLQGPTALDAVSVVWLNEPPSIITPPNSLSAFAGGTVSFLVGAAGVPPLSYQWYFNGALLPGETQNTLTLEGITAENVGSYTVMVSNDFGTAVSAAATLVVQTPEAPVIRLQPFAEAVPVHSYVHLSVAALGTPPLAYQWLFNGQPLEGATNREFTIDSVAISDAGTYSVVVRNYSGTDTSLPAELSVVESASSGTTIWFGNSQPFGHGGITPVYDVDGVTKLAGSEFAAQLYAGASVDSLRPCGKPSFFQVGYAAGQIHPEEVFIPQVELFGPAYAEVRAWQWSYGCSYEEARALGGKYGRSPTVHTTVLDPVFLIQFPSFSLRAGLPQFEVGEITVAEHQAGSTTVWSLRGQPGARYLIEKSGADFNWQPLLLLQNDTGIVTFNDPTEGQHENQFYRARILD
jgi:hypothetical protein